jgi:alpha-beta hydrolase superfamily lysophospholipase
VGNVAVISGAAERGAGGRTLIRTASRAEIATIAAVHFSEITIETDRLAFPALAAGAGPVVVCWHGFPDHPATFGPLAEHLVASGRRVVAPFLRGHHP